MRSIGTLVLMLCIVVLIPAVVLADGLPCTNYNTTFRASVMEQADISVPDEVDFDVTDVTAATNATGLLVSATSVVLDDGNALRIELIAEGDDFSPPDGASPTWSAGDITWNAAAWTGGTGAAGTLSSAAYTKVADSTPNAAELSSSAVTWTLASKTPDKAGSYELSTIWKFSSFTPP